jgi:N-methylhydantoinase A
MEVDVAAAEAGIEEQIAAPLGLSTAEAASGIVALTEAKMAATLEEMTIGKGHDPRDFTLVAYGGGGPLVACSLATRLSIPRVIVPPSPATLSAWGMLTLDVVHDLARSQVMHLSEVSPDDVRTMFSELADDGQEALAAEGVSEDRRRLVHAIDMRYDGQEHTLTIAVDEAMLANPDMEKLRDLFGAEHEVAYGYQMPDPVEVTAFRVRAIGELDEPRMAAEAEDAGAEPTPIGVRQATHHGSGGRIEWKIYDRDQLRPGQRLSGPAIVEETATTVLVSPQQELSVDGYRNLIIETVGVDQPKGA